MPIERPALAYRRTRNVLAAAVAIAAPLFTLAFIAMLGVNGPDWDHLIASELFNRWHDGTLTARHLFAQHNEHRPVIPRLVVLGLGRLTRFNSLAEMYLQWGLICWTAILLVRAFTRDTSPAGKWDPVAVVPIVLLLFGIRQYEILLVGEGLLTYLSLAFLVTALYCLVARPPSRVSLALAITAAVLASFSQSNALLVWPIGLLALVMGLRAGERRFGPVATIVWAMAAGVVLWAYFREYADPGNHPSARFVLDAPKVGLLYFLSVGGAPLAGELWAAVGMGISMLVIETVLAIVLLVEWWRSRVRLPLGVWLIVCAVATQVMITLNRAGFGLEQSLASRYSAYLSLAPIGVYWTVRTFRPRWGAFGERFAIVMVTVMLVGWTSASIEGWFSGKAISAVHKWHAYLLYTARYQPESLLKELYPNPHHARLYSAGLERLKLNVFAEDRIDPSRLTPTSVRPPFFLDRVNGQPGPAVKTLEVTGEDGVVLDGRAMDPDGAQPAAAVFVTIDGAIDIPSMMAADPPDRIGVVHSSDARRAGFRASFSAAILTPGVHRVSLKVVAADGVHAFVSEPLFDVVKR